MAENVKCKNCNNLVNGWCEKVIDSPDPDMQRDCQHFCGKTNADRIRAMSDEELADFFDKNFETCEMCRRLGKEKCNGKCSERMLIWLKQPAED